jgi:hypothetical protein
MEAALMVLPLSVPVTFTFWPAKSIFASISYFSELSHFGAPEI